MGLAVGRSSTDLMSALWPGKKCLTPSLSLGIQSCEEDVCRTKLIWVSS